MMFKYVNGIRIEMTPEEETYHLDQQQISQTQKAVRNQLIEEEEALLTSCCEKICTTSLCSVEEKNILLKYLKK